MLRSVTSAQRIIEDLTREGSWWHGTTGEAGRKIAASGVIQPANDKAKRGLAPMEGRSYLAGFHEALRYAAFRCRKGETHGAVVEVGELGSFTVDEDVIADMLSAYKHYRDLVEYEGGYRLKASVDGYFKDNWNDEKRAQFELGQEIYRRFVRGSRIEATWQKAERMGNYEYYTQLGKSVLRAIKPGDQIIAKLNKHGKTMAHVGPAKVSRVLIFPLTAVGMASGKYQDFKPISLEELERVAQTLTPRQTQP